MQPAQVLRIGMRTIDRVKKRFIEEGLDAVLDRKPTTRIYARKVDGDLEANILSLCRSAPPKGHSKWTFRLLADKLVELDYIDKISHVTVGNILKKSTQSLENKRLGYASGKK